MLSSYSGSFRLNVLLVLSLILVFSAVAVGAGFFYENENSELDQMRNTAYSRVLSLKLDRENITETISEVFYSTLEHNIARYRLSGKIDTLKTLSYSIEDLITSAYFSNRLGRWDDRTVLEYMAFRIEYAIIRKYFSKFSLKDFKNTDVYKNLINNTRKADIPDSRVDALFSQLNRIRFEPVHFYYRPRSIEEQLIADTFDIKQFDFDDLLSFSATYSDVLKRAEKKYKVNREIIIAILRKETNLGRVPLNYNPFEVLLGQSLFAIKNFFHDKEDIERSEQRIRRLKKSAESSLLNIVKYTLDNDLPVKDLSSNFVGALGFTQFMPFNLHLAVDGSGDGKADLSNMEDAIMSIGNFLNHNGWREFYELDISNREHIERLILRYNTSRTYAESVYEIALELKRLSL